MFERECDLTLKLRFFSCKSHHTRSYDNFNYPRQEYHTCENKGSTTCLALKFSPWIFVLGDFLPSKYLWIPFSRRRYGDGPVYSDKHRISPFSPQACPGGFPFLGGFLPFSRFSNQANGAYTESISMGPVLMQNNVARPSWPCFFTGWKPVPLKTNYNSGQACSSSHWSAKTA